MPGRVGDRLCAVAGVATRRRPQAQRSDADNQPKEDLVLRPKLDWRAAVSGGALCLAYACAAAVPAAAPADETQGTPIATVSKVDVSKRQLNVRLGRRAVVRGHIRPAGSTVALQVRRKGHWVTLDRDRTDASGAYVLRDRMHRPQSAHARVKVSTGGPVAEGSVTPVATQVPAPVGSASTWRLWSTV